MQNKEINNDNVTYKEPYIKLFTSGIKAEDRFDNINKLAESLINSTALPQSQLSKLVENVATVIKRTSQEGQTELISSQIKAEEFFLSQFDEPISGYINEAEQAGENADTALPE